MKNFTFVHETPSHFVLHNGRAHFHVAKNGIDEPTADKIRALAKGGKTVAGDKTQKENQALMSGIDKKLSSQNYEDGGEVKKDTDLDNPPSADLDYKPTPLPTPEPQPKRRQIEAEMPEPQALAEGGKLDANARAHIAPHNFALPGGRYPIHDENHARNALARVSQHGTPEEKAKVRAAVHSKYPGIEQSHAEGGQVHGTGAAAYRKPEKYDDGGQVPLDPDKAQSAQDSMRKAFGYSGADGSPSDQEVKQRTTSDPYANFAAAATQGSITPQQIQQGARSVDRSPASVQDNENNKAGGGPVESNAVQDISHETQTQAIGRYAAGNPANLAKGGASHFAQGKYHFHFYDAPDYSSKQPEQPPTPLDQETRQNYAGTSSDPSASVVEPSAMQLSAADLDPNTVVNPGYNKPTELQQEIDAASQPESTPSPEQSANNLAGAMGKEAPFEQTADQAVPSRAPAGNGPVVAPQNQISMTPKSVPPSPGQNVDLLTEFNKNLQGEQEAIRQGATNTAKSLQDQNDILKNHMVDEEISRQKYDEDQKQNTAQADYLFQQVANNKVDPNRYWSQKSTGGKIAAGIGLLLGGISSGLTGRANPALDVIQNAIKEDVQAQRDNQTTNMNLYKMGLQKYKDRQAAEDYATLHSNTLAQGMLQVAANKSAIPAAKNSANMAISQLGLQNIQLRTNLAMQQAALNAMNGPAVKSGLDLNKLNLLKQSGFIPKEDVPDLNKEAADYGKLSNILDTTDSTFNQARQNQTYTERALPGWTPTIRDSSKRYEAATNQWLGNITHETEGRVTPMDVDLMRASLPKAGDPPDLYQTKLNNVKDMIRQKYSFPNLMEKRIISPNDSVAIPSSTRKKRFNESPVK